jgi:pyruvate ferredoxin oxidoreductase delta subunit
MKNNLAVEPGSTRKNKTGTWRTFRPEIDIKKCIGCGACERACPEGAISMKTDKNGKKYSVIDYDYCKGCGLCEAVCPVKCIKMKKEDK